jgi:DtxR family Mn-dependent transcriptional regulator
VDPHGSPIPDINGDVAVQNYQKLEECIEDQQATFMSVGSSQDSFLKLIDKLNIKLGDKIKILEIQDFDKSMRVLVNNESEKLLSQVVSANILVQLNG